MIKRCSTGMFDKHGDEIFVGDIVEKVWGVWVDSGLEIRKHTITKHTYKNIVEYRLDNTENIWSGEDVVKIAGELHATHS